MTLLYTHFLSTVLKCNCLCVHVLKFLFYTGTSVEWGRKRDPFNFSQARGSIELGLAAMTVGFSDTDLHIFLIWKWPESVSFSGSEGISQPDVKWESTSWYGRWQVGRTIGWFLQYCTFFILLVHPMALRSPIALSVCPQETALEGR